MPKAKKNLKKNNNNKKAGPRASHEKRGKREKKAVFSKPKRVFATQAKQPLCAFAFKTSLALVARRGEFEKKIKKREIL